MSKEWENEFIVPEVGDLCIIREKEFKVHEVFKNEESEGGYLIDVVLNDWDLFPETIRHTIKEFYDKVNTTGTYKRPQTEAEEDRDNNMPFWTFSPSNKPFFETPEEMQAKIMEYFQRWGRTRRYYDKKESRFVNMKIFTITWLALFLGFSNRQALYAYEAKEAYSDTIKRARTFIEMEYEEQLSLWNTAWAIFALKNFGWKDTQTLETWDHNGGDWKMVIEYVEAAHANYDENWDPIKKEKDETSI